MPTINIQRSCKAILAYRERDRGKLSKSHLFRQHNAQHPRLFQCSYALTSLLARALEMLAGVAVRGRGGVNRVVINMDPLKLFGFFSETLPAG